MATSITAFIGRAKRGPTDEAISINAFADFEQIFGGLWLESPLGYAKRDFYLNDGKQAIIVRLFHPLFADDTARGEAEVAANEVANAAKAGLNYDHLARLNLTGGSIPNVALNAAFPSRLGHSRGEPVADHATH